VAKIEKPATPSASCTSCVGARHPRVAAAIASWRWRRSGLGAQAPRRRAGAHRGGRRHRRRARPAAPSCRRPGRPFPTAGGRQLLRRARRVHSLRVPTRLRARPGDGAPRGHRQPAQLRHAMGAADPDRRRRDRRGCAGGPQAADLGPRPLHHRARRRGRGRPRGGPPSRPRAGGEHRTLSTPERRRPAV
jgi:hypothetical protein